MFISNSFAVYLSDLDNTTLDETTTAPQFSFRMITHDEYFE